MVKCQWGIFGANLSPSRGSEQAGHRPVLVISVEEVNQALSVVTVISLSSYREGRNIYPTEVLLKAAITGLSKDSIAMAYQVRAISKDRLEEKCGSVESEDLKEEIRAALRLYMDV